MQSRRTFLISTLSAAGLAVPAFGQLSPPKTVTGTVGGKNIKIDYYSPSMRGRKIFGSLVPYDEVWCPGANWATAITSMDAGLQIGSMKLNPGSYAIWMLPTEKEWTAIINSDPKAFHLDYRANKDIGRLKMDLKMLEAPVESLAFEIRSEGGNKGRVAMTWERTEASFPFTVTA